MASLILALAVLANPKVVTSIATTPAPSGPPPLVGVAPALTATALRDELRARSHQRQEELAALARQRAVLEKLAADVAASRSALEASQRAAACAKPGMAMDDGSEPTAKPEPSPIAPASSAETLAKTIKGMKADQAAALVQRLDRTLAVDVLRRMRPADAGAILEKMKGETAADLFSAMAAGRTVHPPLGQR